MKNRDNIHISTVNNNYFLVYNLSKIERKKKFNEEIISHKKI